MNPFLRLSSMYSRRASNSFWHRVYNGPNGILASGSRGMVWSKGRCGGKAPGSRSSNKDSNEEYISGKAGSVSTRWRSVEILDGSRLGGLDSDSDCMDM